MSLVRFKAKNHPQQTTRDDVDDRRTPRDFFDPLHDVERFTLDAAASHANALLPRYFVRAEPQRACMWAVEGECGASGCAGCRHGGAGALGVDGLAQSWRDERVWCNPPYSNIVAWVEKAREEMECNCCESVTMLLPANRCEQKWWQANIEPHRDRSRPFRGVVVSSHFLAGRMRFDWPAGRVVPAKGDRPPFGLVLVTWRRA